jgi:hypothetical protein
VRTSDVTYSRASGTMFLYMMTSLVVGLSHFCKIKAVECAEENPNTATGRKFDVSKELLNV